MSHETDSDGGDGGYKRGEGRLPRASGSQLIQLVAQVLVVSQSVEALVTMGRRWADLNCPRRAAWNTP